MVPSVIFGASPRDARQNAGNDESNEDNGRGHGPCGEGIQRKTSQVMSGPTTEHGFPGALRQGIN
jgi:hypothetical protein